MTDGGGSGYFWINTLKNDSIRRSKSSIKIVIVCTLLVVGFLTAIMFSLIAIKDNYNKIYNEGVSFLESGEIDSAIECFDQIPNYIQYKDIKELFIEYEIDNICPNCGKSIDHN